VLERGALQRADAVLVLSQYSRSLIGEDHPSALSKVTVAGGGIDTEVFRPATDRVALRAGLGLSDDDLVLLTVRRLVARTGVGHLVDAFATIHAREPRTSLVVIGDGEDRTKLEARVHELGLRDSVRFLGRIEDEAVIRWYQASDLFVLPTIAYEGFGMSTAEALACGTPVVGTPVGATRELLAPLSPSLISASPAANDLAETVISQLPTLSGPRRSEAREYAAGQLSASAMVTRWLEAAHSIGAGTATHSRIKNVGH
jgi:glycosyltransferase involved in cell wall biosynthesis